MARSVLLLLLLHHSAAFSLLQQRTNAPTALRASDDAIDASSPDAFIAGLMNRVGDLKSRQLELPIVVLDATLPNQRLAISTSDQAFREMIEYCGVKAVEEAGDEQFDDTRHGRFLRHRADAATTTTSRRRLGISTSSSRRYGDNIASMAWGARNLISTQVASAS
jgi:hypothetical protein